MGAKGFTLPSFPEGVKVMLESLREVKAISARIVSFNFIFLTFRRRLKKSAETEEVAPERAVAPPSLFTAISVASFDGERMKKTYRSTKIVPMARNAMTFLTVEDIS